MFHGGFTMKKTSILVAGAIGSALLLSGCVTPYVSGSVGTRIGSGGYVSGTVGGYPYGYGGYGYGNRGYGGYGYGSGVQGYDRYGRPIYRLPDGRVVIGSGYGYANPYDGYYRAPVYRYPGYSYPRHPGYGHSVPRPPHVRPPVVRPGGDSGVPSTPITRRQGGSASGDVIRQARERVRNTPPIEP